MWPGEDTSLKAIDACLVDRSQPFDAFYSWMLRPVWLIYHTLAERMWLFSYSVGRGWRGQMGPMGMPDRVSWASGRSCQGISQGGVYLGIGQIMQP